MSRKFDYSKDRLSMLAGLVDDDDYMDVRRSLTENYENELIEDVQEVDETLNEFVYMGFKPDDSEGEEVYDCACPEKAKPALPTDAGYPETAPGWSYYDADPTYQKISTMKDDLQHKKMLQWYPPLENELESGYKDTDEEEAEVNESDVRDRINQMISEYKFVDREE